MRVKILVAVKKDDGEILFAEGIEDGNSYVQVVVPRNLITEKDAESFIEYDKKRLLETSIHLGFNLGEMEAYHATRDWELIEIKEVNMEIGNNMNQILKNLIVE